MKEHKVSLKQLKILLFLDIFGTGVITLPRVSAEFAGNDGWLLIIGATLITLLYASLLCALAEMFPKEPFHAYAQKIAGKTLGFVLSIALAGKLVFTAGIELRLIGEVIRQTALYKTPGWVTCAAMTALSGYLAHKGYQTRARVSETLFYIVLIPVILLILAAAATADYTNVLPFLKTPPRQLLLGSYYVSFMFRGLEFALLAYPFAKEPEKIKSSQLKALVFTGAAVLLITLATLLKFGENDVKAQLWPVIQASDTFKLAGGLFGRLDALLISIWLISAFVFLSGGIFFSAHIANGLFHGKHTALCALLVFGVSLLPGNTEEAYKWLAVSDMTAGALYMLAIPLLLIMAAKARGIGGESS